MEIIIITVIVVGAIVAIIANRMRKSDAPTTAAKIEPKQPRGANGRFVKKGSK